MGRTKKKNVVVKTSRRKVHLKYLVYSDGVLVGEHAVKETAEKHKQKILSPLKPPTYKGRKLI
jgi:hypothetical protein